MSEMQNLEPKEVFGFFYEISQIPRATGKTDKIAGYLVNFAKNRNLRYLHDKYNNVVIYADGTEGYESSPAVILQSHMDMVCEKLSDCQLDMTSNGVQPVTDGEFVWAEGTTLGADDGIGIAYILAILDSKTIEHPPIEALFTSDEKNGLVGALKFDASVLSGKKLINLDYEEEGVLTVGCAGGIRAYANFSMSTVSTRPGFSAVRIEISGLNGGHSGIDINKYRVNAHCLLGELLYFIKDNIEFGIASIEGGTQPNVISSSVSAVICTDDESAEIVPILVDGYKSLSAKLSLYEPQAVLSAEIVEMPEDCTGYDETARLLEIMHDMPFGVLEMSQNVKGLVQTSVNPGAFCFDSIRLEIGFLVRSNDEKGKIAALKELEELCERYDGEMSLYADYPAWECREKSPLRELMADTYCHMYGSQPELITVHAGLECGILSGKMPDCDMVSFGPNILDVHTTKERLDVASAYRCWNYLTEVLKKCK